MTVVSSRRAGRRLRTVVVGVVSIVLAVLAGCSSGSSTSESGGLLRVVQPTALENFDPGRLSFGNYSLTNNVYEPLLYRADPSGDPQPRLATSWEFDGSELTMQLRSGVTFSDGSKFTADDVVANFSQYQEPTRGTNIAPILKVFTSAEAKGDSTVVFALAEQNEQKALDALDLMFITPGGATLDEIKKGVPGTGPFKVDSYKPGDSLVLVKNDQYWDSKLPKLDKIEIKYSTDNQARLAALQSGGADVLVDPAWTELKSLSSDSSYKIVKTEPASNMLDLLINTTDPALKDVRVRKAIDMALDRSRLAEIVYAGQVKPRCLPWTEGTPGYTGEALNFDCPRDVDGAKKLLSDAGISEGALTLELVTNVAIPDTVTAAPVIASNLQEIGIDVKIKQLENTVWTGLLFAQDYQLAVHTYGRAGRSPSTLFSTAAAWFSGKDGLTGFEDPEYVKLVQQLGVTKGDAFTSAMTKMNELIREQNFLLTLDDRPRVFATSKKVSGFTVNVDGLENFTSTTISE